MKYYIGCLCFVLIIGNYTTFGQGNIEQYTIFGSRIKNPIEMIVKSDYGKLTISAINNSYYPYNLEINFNEFQNLSPRVFGKKTTLLPGNNMLFSFKIIEPDEPPKIGYSISYTMANTNMKSDPDYPYLIPLGKNKKVSFAASESNGIITYYRNQFAMNSQDTVFNSRKGFITAMPGDKTDVERIIKTGSLEIRHDDGTIAVYIGVHPDDKHLKLGQQVYPGQPLGIIGSTKILSFGVYEVQSDGQLKYLELNYIGQDEKLIPVKNLSGTSVVRPNSVIKKEMTKKEMTKFDKGTLY
jgi:hypothetical protein